MRIALSFRHREDNARPARRALRQPALKRSSHGAARGPARFQIPLHAMSVNSRRHPSHGASAFYPGRPTTAFRGRSTTVSGISRRRLAALRGLGLGRLRPSLGRALPARAGADSQAPHRARRVGPAERVPRYRLPADGPGDTSVPPAAVQAAVPIRVGGRLSASYNFPTQELDADCPASWVLNDAHVQHQSPRCAQTSLRVYRPKK